MFTSSTKTGAVKAIFYFWSEDTFYPYFAHLFPHLSEILYDRSEHNAVEYFKFRENRRKEDRPFLMCVHEIIFMRVHETI